MINLKQAVDLARNFLSSSAGMAMLFANLDSVAEKDGKWVVTFKYTPLLPAPVSLTVDIDKDTGEVLGFTKN